MRIKRVYEKPERLDGYRVLVDRVWPRGISKEDAAVDEWLKDVAPSTELRKWFGHVPERFHEFEKRYRKELMQKGDLLQHLKDVSRKQTLTLVYSAKDEVHNQAVVLQKVLREYQPD
ncbi:MAG: DUF488 domain-containing protein [Chlorobi bacterium]|jgi:uncharacterized protein YeaO (DUF488 family)|nr:MAG: DUF488 domain-containing protein [Bacteroidota bacterium]KXK34921.1 MAG: hypothetical protein UZ06_CHB003000829 [Chlorobi bacterium OLB6]MBE2264847.1 DUF488 domain-containing protein [Flavobacteriales bacterium]MBL1161824.1 DUF488 domain-containing protein [Chlorobiota bacterium]MBW7853490.1 DUF488 domain-containing protein [Candidatus Kapabacteria bacterium]MCC6331587.1 DUF488 domain-containing protein [Ignavibacteria bacterium]